MQRDYVVEFLVEDVPRDVEEALLSDGRFAVSRRCGRTVGEGEDLISYIVEGDHLIMLDQDGHRVTGELADHYVLTKQAV